jgi:hypothetical protein
MADVIAEALEAVLADLEISIDAANAASESDCAALNHAFMGEFAAYLTVFRDKVKVLYDEWMEPAYTATPAPARADLPPRTRGDAPLQ